MRFQIFASTFLLVLFTNSDIGPVSGQSEKELLLELRNNLTYDPLASTKLVHWEKSVDFCRWDGVKCDANSRVTGLDLSGESITGGIGNGSSLFKLLHLQSLSLAENYVDLFESELPPQFGQLTKLTHLNLSNSGSSGQIPSAFSNLTRLVVLDLSSTYPLLVLENPDLGGLIHNLKNLRELYLDMVNVSANGNDWASVVSSSLPNLRVLSLSNAYLTGPFDSSLLKLRSLSVIRLDGNFFSSPFPEFFAEFNDLEVFTLSTCDFSGVFPLKLFRIKSLQIIDLSYNRDLEGSLPEFPLNGSLQSIKLGNSGFSGPIPSTIRNLNNLVFLDLSVNHFSGPVPSFAFLKNLQELNLRGNRLTGRIPDSTWEGLENLGILDLSDNFLQGEVPSSLFALPLLQSLTLSNNSFSGSIKASTNVSSPLFELHLSLNDLEGPIPRFIFDLNLSSLSLAYNKLNGSVYLADLKKLSNLESLDLSFNDLSLHFDEELRWSEMFPMLGTLKLASCNLQKLPNLRNQPSLIILDLSDNLLEGEIPNWLWRVGDDGFLFRVLNLSHNRYTHLQQPYTILELDALDLHSNVLVGVIPTPPPSVVIVDFSSNNFSSPLPPEIGNSLRRAMFFSVANNKISGTIPPSFCNATGLHILNLSNNTLHGEIPSCLMKNSLSVLNLRRNILEGEIPDTFPAECQLETLDLSWNLVRGKVPRSLVGCKDLQVLNLGNNHLNDTFPCWLNSLSKLAVLALRLNMFHGSINCLGERNTTWPNLQIMDVASNNINGVIPSDMLKLLQVLTDDDQGKYLDHLHFGYPEASGYYYEDTVPITLKGFEIELQKILTIFTSVDFSDNRLQGPIPDSIGEATSLYLLNFSKNSLSGHIPPSIGNLSKLESLDLSSNALDGTIPVELVELTFLSFLNVSHNHLVGRIPAGRQIQTFSESSFIGNDGLCGFPLNRSCEEDGRTMPKAEEEEEEREEFEEREVYVSVALGFVVGLGFVFGPVVLCKWCRRCYSKICSRFISLLFPQLSNEEW